MAEGEHARGWWIAFALACVSTCVLSGFAYAGRLPPAFFTADKEIHFTVAGTLAFLLDRATGARSFRWILGLLAVFAADEIMQRFSINRSSNFADYAADLAGVLVFVTGSRLFSKARRAKPADDVAE